MRTGLAVLRQLAVRAVEIEMVAVVRAALAGEAAHGVVAELIVAAVAVLQPGEPPARAVVIAAGAADAVGDAHRLSQQVVLMACSSPVLFQR